MEKWDAYDGHLNKIDGLTLIRGEEIPDGVFHLCCEIIYAIRTLIKKALSSSKSRPLIINGLLVMRCENCHGMKLRLKEYRIL